MEGTSTRTRAMVALAASLAIASVTGCTSGTESAARGHTVQAAPTAPPTGSPVAALPQKTTPAPQGTGELVVTYEAGATQEDQQAQQFLQANEVLEGVAAHANSRIALPHDMPLTGRSCGEVNAFWDPETQSITLCYELISQFAPVFSAQNTTGTEAQQTRATEDDLIGFTNSSVLHELGHGLIDVYDLATTGKEEDAADQLATLLLVGDSLHREYAVSSIDAWGALAVADEQGDVSGKFSDEHSLSAQRFYNEICWLYGSDPSSFQGVVQTAENPDGVLPETRAARCPAEFEQMNDAWSTLLQPYLKS
ncbi:DUF4344 domain-containing metallopeptidase [Streptomyces sp. LN549]|uniref:DUF4344 domain-containing metallopeptidase n=1 Tax=Streptomyces sp. LN549 TaxID=3112979 RepID=UPI00371E8306